MREHRSRLLSGNNHNFLFMRRNGEPFHATTQFSAYLKKSYVEYAENKQLTVTNLRKSLVNYTNEQHHPEHVTNALARLMAHSRRTQQSHYATVRAAKEMQLATKTLSEDTAKRLGGAKHSPKLQEEEIPSLDQIVALVTKRSTKTCPDILLGKVVAIDNDLQTAKLAWLAETEDDDSCYKMVIGNSWREPLHALIHPIDIVYDKDIGCYQLRMAKTELHEYVHTPPDSDGKGDHGPMDSNSTSDCVEDMYV